MDAKVDTGDSVSASVNRLADTNKLLGLELLRFVCALAVLVWHYQHFAYLGSTLPSSFATASQPLYPVLAPLYQRGYYGVDIFWCISGFIFFWRYRDAIANRLVSGKKFFVLRFSRLYPLHIATLLLVALLQPIYSRANGSFFVYPYNDLPHFGLQLFMASNWGLEKGASFNGPIWSISLEVLVYGVFYLLLAYLGRSWLVSVAVIGICALLRMLNVNYAILDCLEFYYAGGLAAIVYRSIASRERRAVATYAAWCVIAAVPIFAAVFAPARHTGLTFPILVAYTPILLFCLCADFKAPPLVRRCIEAAGNMTYSSYLLHFPLQLTLVLAFAACNIPVPFHSTGFFCAFIGVTLLASYFTYEHFERPAQRLLRRRLG